jgi:hypothetical protein
MLIEFARAGAPIHEIVLTSGTDFGLSGTAGGLAPGDSSSLVLTATNPQPAPIVVTSVTVSVTTVPGGCPASNLSLGGTGFTGTPPTATVTGLAQAVQASGSASIPLPIMLAGDAPSGCQNVTFGFGYAGTATYATATPPPAPATVTAMFAHPDPVRTGHPVMFSASVSASAGTPSGTVTFYLCTRPPALPPGPAPRCKAFVALGRPVVFDGIGAARLKTSALPPGRQAVFAGFRPASGTAYLPSLSRTVTEIVVGKLRFRGGSRPRPAAGLR